MPAPVVLNRYHGQGGLFGFDPKTILGGDLEPDGR
jgi:hypothetical protein